MPNEPPTMFERSGPAAARFSNPDESAATGVSIIVPTLNEAGNIGGLIRAIAASGKLQCPHEVIVVDDGSEDGTQAEVTALSGHLPVTLVERGRKWHGLPAREWSWAGCPCHGKMGLASAVVEGVRHARFDIVLVMDADGSHPPKAIPDLIKPVRQGRAPMAVGSRYVEGGKIEGWPITRLMMSRLATLAALPLSPVKDPMSGFFAVRKRLVAWDKLRPAGFKIALEIMCRSLFEQVVEVPIVFRDRKVGKTKAGAGVLVDYGVQLALLALHMLRHGRFPFGQFMLVGLVGMVVDYAVFAGLLLGLEIDALYAQTASFFCAVVNNFVWNRRWTFRAEGGGAFSQFVRFLLVTIYAFLLRTILFFWLSQKLGLSPYLCLFVGIVAATAVNYLGSANFAFKEDYLSARFGWLLVGFLLFLKLLYGAEVDLVGQEAYYWDYARHPALSYFDHPPLLAWSIWLSTWFFGDTEFAVRLVSVSYALAACLGLYLLARDWYGRKTAAAGMVAYMLLPLGFVYSFVATPDAPLLALCFLAAWATGRAVKSGDNRWFVLVGLFCGLGALAKYSMIVLALGIVSYALWERKLLSWLRSGWVWLGVAICAVACLPILAWNYQNAWASFDFQLSRRVLAPEEGKNNSLYNLGIFCVYHVGLLTPFAAWAGICGVFHLLKRRRREDRLFLSLGLAFVLAFLAYSIRGIIKPGWTLPGLLLLSPAVFEALENRSSRIAKVTLASVRWSFIVLAFVYAAVMYHAAFLLPGVNPIPEIDGWREFGRVVAEKQKVIESETGKTCLIIADGRYDLAAHSAFYAHSPDKAVGRWAIGATRALAFKYWLNLEDFRGKDALYIARRAPDLENLAVFADAVDVPERVRVFVSDKPALLFWLVRLRGYRPPAAR